MKEMIERHKILWPNTFIETCITVDGDSEPFIEFRFLGTREWNKSEYSLSNPYHFLSLEQAIDLRDDLNRKITELEERNK